MCKMMSKGSKEVFIVCNALNAFYVKEVKSGVCGFYATLYTEYRFNVEEVKSVYRAPCPSKR